MKKDSRWRTVGIGLVFLGLIGWFLGSGSFVTGLVFVLSGLYVLYRTSKERNEDQKDKKP
jgi:uncharacterized membrane protein YuzA (DUF378 family)